jgi:glycosyltransferase involved in cell wall biosynthesis
MKYSVVIPVFNSEKTIGAIIDNLVKFFGEKELDFEIVLVNDGSKDLSWSIINQKIIEYPKKILAIDLIKNHGQHIANFCGLENSTGDYIITMDDDGQNPVNEISKLIQKSKEGYEIVIGKFIKKKHSLYRRLGSKLVKYLVQKIFQTPKNLYLSNFRIIKRNVINRIIRLNIANPYLPGLLISYSSSHTNIIVDHIERKYGKSRYSILKIIKIILELLFNHSTYPIRIITFFGFFVSLISFVLGFFYILNSVLYGTEVSGWTTVVVLVSFLSGLNLIILTMLSEYVIRINKNLSSKNKYFIRQLIKE